jgi:hypothetical protein
MISLILVYVFWKITFNSDYYNCSLRNRTQNLEIATELSHENANV